MIILSFFLVIFVVAWIFFIPYYRAVPPMPKHIPNESVWEGGADGGNWIYCTTKNDTVFSCKVFEDNFGYVLYEGDFIYEDGIINIGALRKQLGVYSGENIYLKNGKKLITKKAASENK